jgi:hypothetical protein
MHKLGPQRIGPFTILEQIGTVAYKLELPHSYLSQKIHPVFYVGLLFPATETADIRPPQQPPPPPEIVDGEEHYEVEKILCSRRMGRGIQYLIKWKGYPDPTWEKSSDLVNADEALQDFLSDHPDAVQHQKIILTGIFFPKGRQVKDIVTLSHANFVKRLTLPNPAPHHSHKHPLFPCHNEQPGTIAPAPKTTSVHAQQPSKRGCSTTTHTNYNPWSIGSMWTQ